MACYWCSKDKKICWWFHAPFPFGGYYGWKLICAKCKIKLAQYKRRELFVRYHPEQLSP